MRKPVFVIIVLVLVAAAISIWALNSARKDRDRTVITGSGTIEATEVAVSPKVSGRIEEIRAEEGGQVKKGNLLIRLASEELAAKADELKAAVEASKAQLAQAQDNLQNARVELGRAQTLYSQGALARQQLDSQQTRVSVLEAQVLAARKMVDQASSGLKTLDTQIANYSLYAPLDATVLSKNAEVGEMALPGMALLTLGDFSKVWMKVYVTEPDLGRVKLGQRAKVTTDAPSGTPHWGQVSWISEQAEFTPKNVQTKDERAQLVYAVKVLLDNPDRSLKPGMIVDAEINLRF